MALKKSKSSEKILITGKESKFEEVANAIFSILARRGLENLTHTRVASTSKVSRAWIYKYIGKTQKELVDYSLLTIGRAFARTELFNDQLCPKEVRKSLFRGTFEMLDNAKANPDVMAIYYRYIGSGNVIGEKVREIDHEHVQSVKNRVKRGFKFSESEALSFSETLHSLRMGLAHRYSTLEMHREHSNKEVLKALHRIFKGFAIEIAEFEDKS
jgi:hypothetical protein